MSAPFFIRGLTRAWPAIVVVFNTVHTESNITGQRKRRKVMAKKAKKKAAKKTAKKTAKKAKKKTAKKKKK